MDDLLAAFSLSQQSQSQTEDAITDDEDDANVDTANSGYGLDVFSDNDEDSVVDEPSHTHNRSASASDGQPSNEDNPGGGRRRGTTNMRIDAPHRRADSTSRVKRKLKLEETTDGTKYSAVTTGNDGNRLSKADERRRRRQSKNTHRRNRPSAHARVCKLCGQTLKGHSCPFKRPQPTTRVQAVAQRLPPPTRDRFAAVSSLLLVELQQQVRQSHRQTTRCPCVCACTPPSVHSSMLTTHRNLSFDCVCGQIQFAEPKCAGVVLMSHSDVVACVNVSCARDQ